MTQITVADLDNAKLDVDTIADIANDTGVSVIDRLGATRLTANEAIRRMGYQVPVTYATSLVMSTLTQTVDYLGVVYAPLPTMIPFTTSGTFETAKFYVIQNNEIVKKYNTYADILASGGAILDNTRADTSGYHSSGDGGGNSFYYSTASTATHNGGTVIKPTAVSVAGRWIAVNTEIINVKQFGAHGDGATDDISAIQKALDSGSKNIYLPSGIYRISNTIKIPSKLNLYGDGQNMTIILQQESNSPVLASSNYYSALGAAISGYVKISDVRIKGGATIGTSNHGVVLRDYYSTIKNVTVENTGGNGIHITTTNDVGTVTSGTLVENRIIDVSIRNPTGYGIWAGALDNNKITDGFIENVIVSTSSTSTSHILIGSAAGWNINGVHTYGISPTDDSIAIYNSYHTNIDNIYIECMGNSGLSCFRTQRSLALNNITVKAVVSSAPAILLDKSSAVSACEVTISGLHVVNDSANTSIGVKSLSSAITIKLGVSSFSNTGSGAITKFSLPTNSALKRVLDAVVDGTLRESTNKISLKHNNQSLALCHTAKFDGHNPSTPIIKTFAINTLPDYSSIVGTLSINSRINHNAGVRLAYMGQIHIKSKVNGTNAWLVSLLDITVPSGFSANPSASIVDAGDGTGTLTITFTPTDTDGYGQVSMILSAGETI